MNNTPSPWAIANAESIRELNEELENEEVNLVLARITTPDVNKKVKALMKKRSLAEDEVTE